MGIFGDITDREFVELKKRFGDIVLEEPSIAIALVEDLRGEEKAELLLAMEAAIWRQERRKLH